MKHAKSLAKHNSISSNFQLPQVMGCCLSIDGAVTQQDLRPFDLGEVARAFENRSLSNLVRPTAKPDDSPTEES